jgi:hypothetical protein
MFPVTVHSRKKKQLNQRLLELISSFFGTIALLFAEQRTLITHKYSWNNEQ